MIGFEYKVVPAPVRGLKAKGVKGTQARFANALQTVMNELGAQGWEYQRTDTLPVEERQGLTGKTTSFQNMLVFRRALADTNVAPDVADVAALIEDQTDVLEAEPEVVPEMAAQPITGDSDILPEDVVPQPDAPKDDIAAQTDTPQDPAPEPDTPEEFAAKSARTLAADERITKTLRAPFAFPWSRRTQQPPANTEDDIRPAAE